MPIYIYKENRQVSTNAIRNHKAVKAIYSKEQGQDAVCVWGDDTFIYEHMFTYSISDNKVTITGLKPEVKAAYIIIPNSIENKPVSSIGASAFEGKSSIVSITIPDSVTSIDGYAFKDCTSLTSVTIPDRVTSIGDYTFYNCTSLTNITIPTSVTTIGEYAFSGCTSFTSVTIPYSVTTIGLSAFSGCTSLTTVNLKTINCQVAGSYIAPIFKNCTNLATVNIFNNVKIIPSFIFQDCTGLTSITIPTNVTKIGSSAFRGCTGLTSITIPASVTTIGEDAFFHCYSLTSVILGNNVTKIGSSAFQGCTGLTSITIPASISTIDTNAFYACYRLVEVYNKSHLSITAGSYSNGYVAYYAKNVYTTEGGSKLATDENGYVIYTERYQKILIAYLGTETESALPSYITQINQYAFFNCTNLTSVTFGANSQLTVIGDYAFYGCSSLTSITIPNSVVSVKSYAFSGCTSLIDIYYTGTVEQWNAITKGSSWNINTGNYTIHCTDGSIPKQN